MPRSLPGALIEEPKAVGENAVRLVKEGLTKDDQQVKIDTLCLHGDHPDAVNNAKAVRLALEAERIEIRSMVT
jgi:UPF0271 protein